MNVAVILRSREMLNILTPFLDGHNVMHYTSKEDFLKDIKTGGQNHPSFLSENLVLIVNAGISIGEDVLSYENIKLVQQFGIGYENIDLGYASKKSILVFNAPTNGTYNAVSVAELSLFFIIALARDYNGCVNSISHGIANQPMGHSISEKKFAIIGLGGIGQEIIKMLKPFKPEIYGLKHSKPQDGYAEKLGIKFTGTVDGDFKKILPSVDYIILAVPLEKNTENLIDGEAVGLMKSGAYVINVGRAGLINKDSLIK